MGKNNLPQLLSQRFSATANVTADQNKLELKNFVMNFIGTKGVGSAEFKLGNNLETNVILSLNKLDLDAIISPRSDAPKISTRKDSSKSEITEQVTLRPSTNSPKKIAQLLI